MKNNINLMIIGLGLHARRVYTPYLKKLSDNNTNVNLKLGVDLKSQKDNIEEYLRSNNFPLEMVYFNRFDYRKGMPKDEKFRLNELVKKNNIDGVLITTEPLVHKEYAIWALSQGLHILMDKPITTRMNVFDSLIEADGIYNDYCGLLNLYKKLQNTKKTIFSINVQRRYEIGHQKVFELIREVSEKFNAPITSIQAMHSDGVWIFPNEIVDQLYHPYSQGYGKNSHSGYHIFDIIWQYYLSGKIEDKFPNQAEVMTSYITPIGLLKQFCQKDYYKYFGNDYKKVHTRTDDELFKIYKRFGEIDAFSILRLLKDGDNICNISINLLHNSFSRRAWLYPSKDLYKGNGRVKHQSYIIQQGPFQCIQVHNYQSDDKQDQSDIEDYQIGGNNHFDIYVFRNAAMFGNNEKPLTIYNLKSLDTKNTLDDAKLFHEKTKEAVVTEFIDFIKGKIKDTSILKSNIDTHEIPVKIMSSICKSNVMQIRGKSPIVKFDI